MTTEYIRKQLKEIERSHNVKILMAIESGSRAWGFASPDSDWDVRFIYVHPVDWYLQVESGHDVIEVMTDEGFDAAGWDLRKALQLFRKTNPSMLEWLTSPIRYVDRKGLAEFLVEMTPYYFNPTRAIHHYYSIAEKHNERYLMKNGMTLKRFLYYLRSLLACKWIMTRKTPPPVPFRELADSILAEELQRGSADTAELRTSIAELLDKKSRSKEHDKDEVNPRLTDYAARLSSEVAAFLADTTLPLPDRSRDSELNAFLYRQALAAGE